MLEKKSFVKFVSFFVLFLCFSCGHQSSDKAATVNSDFQVKDEWYRGDIKFQFWEGDEKLQTHAFFDADPKFTESTGLINYVPLTVKDSNILYDLDLHSGKLFKVADLCLQDDVWGSFSPRVQGPSFTLGVIPRSTLVLEKVEEFKPQRIAVFHHPKDRSIKKDVAIKEFSRAKILGSFYLEECLTYPCRNKDSWKKELILVGVNIKDQSKSEIEDSKYNDFSELRTTRDWAEAKVFFQSQLGVHRLGKSETFPRFRVVNEEGIEVTKKRIQNEMRLRNHTEIMGFRNGCRSLFDKAWSEIESIRKSADPREELKKFSLKVFKEGDKEIYNRCLTYVRPANLNLNPDRFWFFQFLRAAIILDNSGFYYDCAQSTWYPNPKNADSKSLYSTYKELNRCKSREAELIYEKAIIGMGLMQNQVGNSFRFTEYDTQSGGSFQKLYSWVPVGTKRLNCPTVGKIVLEDVFPEDVNWQEFPDGKKEGIR